MGDEDNSEAAVAAAAVYRSMRCRWILTLRASPDAPPGGTMFPSFFLRSPRRYCQRRCTRQGYINRDAQGLERKQEPRAMIPAVCAVNGCTAKRMYRLVRDWEHEACHILERWYYGPGPVVVSAIHLWGPLKSLKACEMKIRTQYYLRLPLESAYSSK